MHTASSAATAPPSQSEQQDRKSEVTETDTFIRIRRLGPVQLQFAIKWSSLSKFCPASTHRPQGQRSSVPLVVTTIDQSFL